MATTFHDHQARDILLHMAHVWLRLAEDNHEMVARSKAAEEGQPRNSSIQSKFSIANRWRCTYRVGLFAGSTLSHCGRCALTVPSATWMTPPSVIIPRSANKLKRAKQLSGIASASNKSRFMAKWSVSGFAAQPNSSPLRRSDNAVQKI